MQTTSTSLAPTWSRLLRHAIAHATCFDVLSLHLYVTYIFVSGLADVTPPLTGTLSYGTWDSMQELLL